MATDPYDTRGEWQAWFYAEWRKLREIYGVETRTEAELEGVPDRETRREILRRGLEELDVLVVEARKKEKGRRANPLALKKFARKLTAIMGELELTKAEVMAAMGRSGTALPAYMRGESCPSAKMWPKIRAGLAQCVEG